MSVENLGRPMPAREMTAADVRAFLADMYEAEHVADVVEAANADIHEGPDWLPYYKAEIGHHAGVFGALSGLVTELIRELPRHAREPYANKLKALVGEYGDGLLFGGAGPNYRCAATMGMAEAKRAEFVTEQFADIDRVISRNGG